MANELDTLSDNDIQPFNEGLPVLAPLSPSPDTWGKTDVLTNQEIDEYQRQPQGPTLFGSQLPPGTTKQQVDVVLGQLGAAFMNDMSSLGYPAHMVQAAIQFVQENALKKPYSVQKNHGLNLHGENDYLATAFGNMVQNLSGSPKAKQAFATAALVWLHKATAKLNKPEGSGDMPRMAPTSSEAMLNQLSDSDYNKVIAINERALANTMQVLQLRWGDYTFRQNIEIAQSYLEKLPAADQRHFDQFTSVNGVNWIHLRNTPEFIIAMFEAACGAHSIPKDGAGIAREIAECEQCMRTNRKQWLADSALQARYRTLLDLQRG